MASDVWLSIPRARVTAVRTALGMEAARRVGQAQNPGEDMSVRAIYQAEASDLMNLMLDLDKAAVEHDNDLSHRVAGGL